MMQVLIDDSSIFPSTKSKTKQGFIMANFPILFLIVSQISVISSAKSIPDGFRAELTAVKPDQQDSGRRLCTFKDAADGMEVPTTFTGGMYHMEFSVGTPPIPVKGVVDTGSSLTWVMCDPRVPAVYLPNTSSTSEKVPCKSPLCNPGKYADNCTEFCTYGYTYNDGNYIKGTIFTEKLTFGDVAVPDVVVGCSSNTSLLGEPGIVGFGMANISLIGQLGLSRFSVCLSSNENLTSPVFFGSAAVLKDQGLGTIKSIPFVNHPGRSRDYWVKLNAVTIGNTTVVTPWEATEKPDGKGLMGVDTGSDMSTFVMSTYKILKEAFIKEVKLPVVPYLKVWIGEGICFKPPPNWKPSEIIGRMPKVVYRLDGADLEFPNERFYVLNEEKDLVCVKMRGMERNISLWGNHQMMDMHMLFDVGKQRLFFVPAKCEEL